MTRIDDFQRVDYCDSLQIPSGSRLLDEKLLQGLLISAYRPVRVSVVWVLTSSCGLAAVLPKGGRFRTEISLQNPRTELIEAMRSAAKNRVPELRSHRGGDARQWWLSVTGSMGSWRWWKPGA